MSVVVGVSIKFSQWKLQYNLETIFDLNNYCLLIAYPHQLLFTNPMNNFNIISCPNYIADLTMKILQIKIQIFTFNTLNFFGFVIAERL